MRRVFVLQGGVVGVLGSTLGVFAGLLVAANVNGLFGLTEGIVNTVLGAVGAIARPFVPRAAGGFSIFSPVFFYLSEVPVRVLLPETVLIAAAGVTSATLSAYLASSRVTDIEPAAVLRYE